MVGGSNGSTNQRAAIGRERVASVDDVKATILKEFNPYRHTTPLEFLS